MTEIKPYITNNPFTPTDTPKIEKKEQAPLQDPNNPSIIIDIPPTEAPINKDYPSIRLQKAIANRDEEEIKLVLTKNPVFCNTTLDNGFHPLHYAIQVADESLFPILIQLGCNPLIKDSHNNNAFDYAALLGYDRVLSVLIASQAEVNADNVMQTLDLVNRQNATPMVNAAYQQVLDKITAIFQSPAMNLAKQPQEVIEYILNNAKPEDLQSHLAFFTKPHDESGLCFIHIVAAAGNAPLFKFLVDKLGVLPNRMTQDEFNPAHFLAASSLRFRKNVDWQAFIEGGLNPLAGGRVSPMTFFGIPAKENDPLKMDHISNLTLVCSLLFLVNSIGLLNSENKDSTWLIETFTALGVGGLVGRAVWRHALTNNFLQKFQSVVALLQDPAATKEALTKLASLIAPPGALISSLFLACIIPSKLGPEQGVDFSFRERFAFVGETMAIFNAAKQLYNNRGYRTNDAAIKFIKELVVGSTTIGITALGQYARKTFSTI